jgi:hypothetical protein
VTDVEDLVPHAGELRPVITYPPDAILSTAHVAAALGCGTRTVERMDLPYFRAGKFRRYVWGQLLDRFERMTDEPRPLDGSPQVQRNGARRPKSPPPSDSPHKKGGPQRTRR